MEEHEALLLLSQTNLHARKLKAVLESEIPLTRFIEDPLSFHDQLAGIVTPDFLSSLESAKAQCQPESVVARLRELGVQIVGYPDANYPSLLREIHNPPAVLYVKGNLISEDRIAVALVGSRYPSAYGMKTAHRFSYELAEAGVTIVSGMARGVDAEAHRGALKARGRTIAVLGSGINVVYPRENQKLYDEISEQGAVVSELPLDAKPLAFNFPMRNRIIAGMSLGVLVVEAHSKSGSLITSSLATEEGREVYAIPGPVDAVQSRGTNTLIQQGAKLVQSSEDILSDLELVLKDDPLLKKSSLPDTESADSLPELSPDEIKILQIFDARNEQKLMPDEIANEAHFESNRLWDLLLRMEFKGKLRKCPGGFFEKTDFRTS